MSWKPIKKLSAKTGQYQDKQTGEQKNRYQQVGILMENEKGELWIKLETLPVNFDGSINVWDLDIKKVRHALNESPAPKDDLSDDMPF